MNLLKRIRVTNTKIALNSLTPDMRFEIMLIWKESYYQNFDGIFCYMMGGEL